MCIDIRLLRSLHLKNPTSLTRCEMICAEQSPMKRTDLGSAVLQSTLGDNCNEIHNKPENFSSHGYSPFICKKKMKSALAISTKSRGKKIPNGGWNSLSVMEFDARSRKWECREIWYSCACSPRGKFFTYIWLCIVSIPQLAMRISASPSLIQAGHRGCQISRAILKYSTAVRD